MGVACPCSVENKKCTDSKLPHTAVRCFHQRAGKGEAEIFVTFTEMNGKIKKNLKYLTST